MISTLSIWLLAPLLVPIQEASLEEVNRISREVDQRVRHLEKTGNALTLAEALRGLEAEYAESGDVAHQVLALHLMQREAELGNYGEALRYGDVGFGPEAEPDASELERLEDFAPHPALAVIEELAEEQIFVLINEAHHVPQHRAFTMQVLVALRKQGFTHFAAESFSERDPGLLERGFATKASGSYLAEPLYADLVRMAAALGYVIVPYESFGADRELGQAQNLIARTLEGHDDARVLVHAGYGHIQERGNVAGSRAMAQRLLEITGIDPLTIEQTNMTEHSTPDLEQGLYRLVLEKLEIALPTVFRNAAGQPWSVDRTMYDVSVFHPRSVYAHGRPTWLAMDGLRQPVPLPEQVCGKQPRVVVQARPMDEPAEAIPIDQVEALAGRSAPVLYLPEGRFTIEVRSAANERLQTFETTVEH